MKIKTILVSMLAVAALAACTKENGGDIGPEPVTAAADVAYLSIRIQTQPQSRASGEQDAEGNESLLKTLYIFTFDNGGNIVGIPGTTNYYTQVAPGTPEAGKPEAFKISAAATKLLVVANPGPKFQTSVISAMASTTTFATVNAAIRDAKMGELADLEPDAGLTKGFAMINSGDEGSNPQAGDEIEDGLIDITGKIKKVADYATETDPEAAAKAAAEADDARVKIQIERLVAKIKLNSEATIAANGDIGTFTFGNWTIDAVNSTFYPFAKKTLLEVSHTPNTFYVKNFYTQDPNFSGAVGSDIDYVTVDRGTNGTYDPQLLTPYEWFASGAKTYSIENTMAAAEQKFGNATRVVIKGTYYPTGFADGSDWFSFNGRPYETLVILKAAYDASEPNSALRKACVDMYTKVSTYAGHNSIDLTGTNFETLTQADLDLIPANGGEIVKNGSNAVINWYQKGLNYYYYEIRHDNSTDAGEMAFGKYGVVRNNWYSLTLTTVGGPGTPWYPDVENPGPGDPDPEDPIDESAGYLGIEITVAPWIIWTNNIGI